MGRLFAGEMDVRSPKPRISPERLSELKKLRPWCCTYSESIMASAWFPHSWSLIDNLNTPRDQEQNRMF